jgi:hypothetical protein
MKSVMGLWAALAVVMLCACGGNSNKTAPVAFEKTAEGAACMTGPGSTDNTQCSGRFGFTVDESGNWTAGPSFQQQVVVHGQITMDELNALQQAANVYLKTVNGTTFCHGSGDVLNLAVAEVVNITPRGQQSSIVSSDLPDPIGCLSADPNAANALKAQLDQMRQKYYPVPFPGE